MSGVFEDKHIRVSQNLPFGTDTSAYCYSFFYCPSCKAKHQFGHRKEYIECYRCYKYFHVHSESYRFEKDRISNLSREEQIAVYKRLHTPHPNCKRKNKKKSRTRKKYTISFIKKLKIKISSFIKLIKR